MDQPRGDQSLDEPGADVLVVSKDDVAVMDATDDTTGTSLSFHAVGPGFVRHAMKQGHNVHTLSRLEDASWEMNNEDIAKMPSWILLAVFDPKHGMEDNMLTSEAATSLLSKCTVTYIVYRISASQKGLYGTTDGGNTYERWRKTGKPTFDKQATQVHGLAVHNFVADCQDRFLAEMADWIKDNRVKYKEDLWTGLESAPNAFRAMLQGGNFGKTLVGVGEDPTLNAVLEAGRAGNNVFA